MSYKAVTASRINYTRSYELELNKFADMTDEEFSAKFGLKFDEKKANLVKKTSETYGGPNCTFKNQNNLESNYI